MYEHLRGISFAEVSGQVELLIRVVTPAAYRVLKPAAHRVLATNVFYQIISALEKLSWVRFVCLARSVQLIVFMTTTAIYKVKCCNCSAKFYRRNVCWWLCIVAERQNVFGQVEKPIHKSKRLLSNCASVEICELPTNRVCAEKRLDRFKRKFVTIFWQLQRKMNELLENVELDMFTKWI